VLPLEEPEAEDFLHDVAPERRDECWWFVLEDGTLVPGDDGGPVAVLVTLRLTRPFGLAARTLRLGPALDALDRLVARHRSRLGRVVPEGSAPRRFP
jgi:hypothetical protein